MHTHTHTRLETSSFAFLILPGKLACTGVSSPPKIALLVARDSSRLSRGQMEEIGQISICRTGYSSTEHIGEPLGIANIRIRQIGYRVSGLPLVCLDRSSRASWKDARKPRGESIEIAVRSAKRGVERNLINEN